MRLARLKALAPLLALAMWLVPTPAMASNGTLNVQIFRPSPHATDLWNVAVSEVPDQHLRWSVGAILHFGKNPFVFVGRAGGAELRHEVIQNQLTLDIFGSLSLFEWVSLGIALPVHLVNTGASGGFLDGALNDVPPAALGDIRLSPKIRIVQRRYDEDGFGLAGEVLLSIPSGLANPDAFVSDGFTVEPALLADYKVGPFLIALNLGARLRASDGEVSAAADQDPFLVASHAFTYRLGARYTVIDGWLDAIGELYGSVSDFTDQNTANLEGILGARVHVPDVGVSIDVGGGSGFLEGWGNTKFRLFAGVGYAPPIDRDQDDDGLEDDYDKCPAEPEDFDGYQDEDGCPERDNDGDGVSDVDDKCPNDAEDKDGYEDADGCPELDNDGDGVADADDDCPLEAEDVDGFEDSNGCPDNDNDRDGIPDSADKCPNDAEVVNGFEDEDGCPDQSLAVFEPEQKRITILQKVYFDLNKATIKEESYGVLRAVAGVLRANPSVAKVRIEGHTDDQGPGRRNQRLSQERAGAVLQFLLSEGVDASRLEALGFGEDRPLVEGKTEEARAKNRRVEFIIVDQ